MDETLYPYGPHQGTDLQLIKGVDQGSNMPGMTAADLRTVRDIKDRLAFLRSAVPPRRSRVPLQGVQVEASPNPGACLSEDPEHARHSEPHRDDHEGKDTEKSASIPIDCQAQTLRS